MARGAAREACPSRRQFLLSRATARLAALRWQPGDLERIEEPMLAFEASATVDGPPAAPDSLVSRAPVRPDNRCPASRCSDLPSLRSAAGESRRSPSGRRLR